MSKSLLIPESGRVNNSYGFRCHFRSDCLSVFRRGTFASRVFGPRVTQLVSIHLRSTMTVDVFIEHFIRCTPLVDDSLQVFFQRALVRIILGNFLSSFKLD